MDFIILKLVRKKRGDEKFHLRAFLLIINFISLIQHASRQLKFRRRLIGPTIGTQAYFQLAVPLFGTGKIVYANRGPQSRAGLTAKPVVPPSAIPIAVMINPTINGFNPWVKLPKSSNVKMKMNEAINSLKKLKTGLSIAGAVAKIPTELPSASSFEALKYG